MPRSYSSIYVTGSYSFSILGLPHYTLETSLHFTMEQIKKKLATLKDEKEAAVERAEEAERMKKEADEAKDKVGRSRVVLLLRFPKRKSFSKTAW